MLLGLIRSNVVDLPTNFSLSYLWCGGFMLSAFMSVQVFTGVILSFLYVADESLSFGCVLGFVNESLFLWLVRYVHIWGVTFIFLLVFVHMGRALYYSSYSKVGVWNVGFILYILLMVEAFLGYILPWHQMSYWAATVLTSILNSIPVIGVTLFSYIVGGFGVSNVTLVRVFSAHVCLAFVIIGVSLLHLFYLHVGGSNNPVSIGCGYGDVIYFHPLFTLKDGFVFSLLLLFFSFFLFFFPDLVLDVESYIEADPMLTPASIKPEWYFLPYYAMLRSIASKVGGIVFVFIFLFLLWVPTPPSPCPYSVFRQIVFWWGFSFFFLLGYLGSCHPQPPFVVCSKFASVSLLLCLAIFKGSPLFVSRFWGNFRFFFVS